AQPVTVGIPFPRGMVPDADALGLQDAKGREVPLQTTPLAHWADGSVKWLLSDFVLGPLAQEASTYVLGGKAERAPQPGSTPLHVEESGGAITVLADNLRLQWQRSALSFFPQVVLAGQDFLDAAATRLVLRGVHGRIGTPRVLRTVVETQGPVRT